LRARDQTELWHKVTRWHLNREEVDLELGIGTNLNNVILEAEFMDFDFDLREVWLNPQRWTRLTREYLDGPETTDFIKRSRIILNDKGRSGVITNMHFKGVTRYDRKHKWGNCLLAATFRGSDRNDKVQPTLTVHSRVSYNAYMLGLDMALVHVLAREISEAEPRRIRLQWHLDVLQLHSFKCLPYLYTQPDLMQVLVEGELHDPDPMGLTMIQRYPTWRSISRWWDKVLEFEASGKTVEEEKYGPFKRIRRRYEEYKQGILVPSTPLSELDFGKVEDFESL
jgi:hypothetical protein